MILQNHKFITDTFTNVQNKIEYFYGKISVLEWHRWNKFSFIFQDISIPAYKIKKLTH